jgi:hypothetical protein
VNFGSIAEFLIRKGHLAVCIRISSQWFTRLPHSNANIVFRRHRNSPSLIFFLVWHQRWLDAAADAVQGKFNYSGNKSWLQEVNRGNIRRVSTKVEIPPNFVLVLYLCMFNYRVWQLQSVLYFEIARIVTASHMRSRSLLDCFSHVHKHSYFTAWEGAREGEEWAWGK